MDHPASPLVETVPISRLYCSPNNPRRNAAAVPHVTASLRRFAWQQPIVARRSGEVIADNTRLKAAQELGMTEVPVWWFDGDDWPQRFHRRQPYPRVRGMERTASPAS